MSEKSHKKGIVYWFTGLAGAGKSTLGRRFYDHLTKTKPNVVLLDGDELRDVFGGDLSYSLEDRKKSALRNSRLCKMLSDQGHDVVCATISLFRECQDWNRKNISNFNEIYIQTPIEVLKSRDKKKLYSRAGQGEMKDVMGIDLPIHEPKNPEVLLINDGKKDIDSLFKEILTTLKIH